MSYFSGLSFREKSAWISLGVILVVYIPYFIYISNLASAGVLTLSSAIGAFCRGGLLPDRPRNYRAHRGFHSRSHRPKR